jgi:putative transposase
MGARVKLCKPDWPPHPTRRGKALNATVSQSGGKWFVSIQTEREVDQPLPHGEAVGIDMGIARFATMSDGSYLEPLNSFKKHQKRLQSGRSMKQEPTEATQAIAA